VSRKRAQITCESWQGRWSSKQHNKKAFIDLRGVIIGAHLNVDSARLTIFDDDDEHKRTIFQSFVVCNGSNIG